MGSAKDRDAPTAATTWEVVHPETGNVVTEYDTEQEARDAAEWYERTYGRKLTVRCV